MTTKVHSMVETAKTIFNATQHIVDAMPDGSRKQIKNLACEVATAVSMEPKEVLGFVNHFVHHTDVAFVTRGKNGGLVKGTKTAKPAKVAKPRVKKAKAATAVADGSSTTV